MSSKLKQLLTVLLSVCVVFAFSSVSAFAEGEGGGGELTDGMYSVDIVSSLGMTRPETPTVLSINGDNATLIVTMGENAAKRYDRLFVGKYEEITPQTEGIEGVSGDNSVTFAIPLKKADLSKSIFYVVRYKKGYSADHDGDWYQGKSGDYYFTLSNFQKSVEKDLTITNNTGMFKAVSSKLVKMGDEENLLMSLSGIGYHYLFKGTYEEAVANGDNRANWIQGFVDKNGKWTFLIPLDKDETYVPIVAISQSYLEKYEQGQNPLKRAFYPRQMEVDRTAATLTTGDYDYTADLTVTNTVKMFKPGSTAKLHTVGGPNSNNYKLTMTLPMDSDSMDKVKAMSYKVNAGTLVEDQEVEIDFDADKEFKEIPVKAGEWIVIQFHSKNNGKWYDRSLFINNNAKTAKFVSEVTNVDQLEGMDEAQSVAYAENNASPELLDALIKAIQVQVRDENTDRYCAAAKACWDKLGAEDKQKDDGYFSDDTGDASKDDALNTAPDKEKELLVVSFGTSFNDSRVATIGAVEKALATAYGNDYAVRRAFTAQIIINHVQARDGEKIDNVKQAMDKAVEAGVKEMIVQPTHLMSGAEFDELKGEIDKYADKINISYAKPLLNSDKDKEAVAKAVVDEAVEAAGFKTLAEAEASKTAFVFMGHGTSHEANVTYTQMQQTMDKLGYGNCFVGTVEGIPAETALPEVKKAVEAKGYTKVVLRPLMVVAGDHANNDMAADEEGSWYYAFVNGGEFEVEGQDQPVNIGGGFGKENVSCQINGLGEIEAVQQLYVNHTKAVIDAKNAVKALADAKANAKAELNKVKTSNYAGAELTKVNNAIKSGKANIDKATTVEGVKKALKNAKDAISKAKTKSQIAAEKNAVKNAKITKVAVKAGKKKVTVTWKKNSKFAGYQIKVINKKTKKTVKTVKVGAKVQKKVVSGLKSKTTFKVQLVGYKTIGGTVVYGKTVTKTVKVK